MKTSKKIHLVLNYLELRAQIEFDKYKREVWERAIERAYWNLKHSNKLETTDK